MAAVTLVVAADTQAARVMRAAMIEKRILMLDVERIWTLLGEKVLF